MEYFDYKLFFTALGLAFIIEAILYGSSPDTLKKVLTLVSTLSNNQIRMMALTLAIFGLSIIIIFK